MTRTTRILLLAILAVPAGLSTTAFAADAKGDLPGVQGNHSIVQPLPEPDAKIEAESPYGPGFVKVGDSWVKISGRVRYDVDVSTRKPDRKPSGK